MFERSLQIDFDMNEAGDGLEKVLRLNRDCSFAERFPHPSQKIEHIVLTHKKFTRADQSIPQTATVAQTSLLDNFPFNCSRLTFMSGFYGLKGNSSRRFGRRYISFKLQ